MRLRSFTPSDADGRPTTPPRIVMHSEQCTTNGRTSFYAVTARRHHDDQDGWYWVCERCERIVGYSPAAVATHLCPYPDRVPTRIAVPVFAIAVLGGATLGLGGAWLCALLGWIG